jgi:membrane-associated protease RseP (regulator of RpoE activity)
LADALAKAGATALAGHVRGEADKKIDEAKTRAAEKIGEKLDKAVGDKAKDALGKLLPGSKE